MLKEKNNIICKGPNSQHNYFHHCTHQDIKTLINQMICLNPHSLQMIDSFILIMLCLAILKKVPVAAELHNNPSILSLASPYIIDRQADWQVSIVSSG